MKMQHYLTKSKKLQKSLNKYLSGIEGHLIEAYGKERALSIMENSRTAYPDIIVKIPFFDTPMYDSLVVLNSRMMALKKGMKHELLNGEGFLKQAHENFLKKVAKRTTKNGWPTQVDSGSAEDSYNMKVTTENCQMVNFMRSVGEEDLVPYCSFADFANAESMGIGLKQTSTIDSGRCTFCFSKKGDVNWTDKIQKVLEG